APPTPPYCRGGAVSAYIDSRTGDASSRRPISIFLEEDKMRIQTITVPATTLLLAFSMTAMAQSVGDSRLFAPVPLPGYPEGIVTHDGKVYVSGPAAFGFSQPSTIFVYNQNTGAQVGTITIQNQSGPIKAISCMAVDDNDNLYVLDETQGVVKINLD